MAAQFTTSPRLRMPPFWARKIVTNKQRDADTTDALVSAGWRVMRFWEHDDPSLVAERIGAAIVERGTRSKSG